MNIIKKLLQRITWLPVVVLIAAVIFAYWDRVNSAKYVKDMGGVIMGVILWYAVSTLGGSLYKKSDLKTSGIVYQWLNRFSWVLPVSLIVVCMLYVFPKTEHIVLNKYGVSEAAQVDDVYYTYEVAPFGWNGLLAGAKKTNEFDATTEVIKYTTINRHISSTLDFPFYAYGNDMNSLVNLRIRQHKTIQIKYLKLLPFVTQLDTAKN